jgi:hypothetical protein
MVARQAKNRITGLAASFLIAAGLTGTASAGFQIVETPETATVFIIAPRDAWFGDTKMLENAKQLQQVLTDRYQAKVRMISTNKADSDYIEKIFLNEFLTAESSSSLLIVSLALRPAKVAEGRLPWDEEKDILDLTDKVVGRNQVSRVLAIFNSCIDPDQGATDAIATIYHCPDGSEKKAVFSGALVDAFTTLANRYEQSDLEYTYDRNPSFINVDQLFASLEEEHDLHVEGIGTLPFNFRVPIRTERPRDLDAGVAYLISPRLELTNAFQIFADLVAEDRFESIAHVLSVAQSDIVRSMALSALYEANQSGEVEDFLINALNAPGNESNLVIALGFIHTLVDDDELNDPFRTAVVDALDHILSSTPLKVATAESVIDVLDKIDRPGTVTQLNALTLRSADYSGTVLAKLGSYSDQPLTEFVLLSLSADDEARKIDALDLLSRQPSYVNGRTETIEEIIGNLVWSGDEVAAASYRALTNIDLTVDQTARVLEIAIGDLLGGESPYRQKAAIGFVAEHGPLDVVYDLFETLKRDVALRPIILAAFDKIRSRLADEIQTIGESDPDFIRFVVNQYLDGIENRLDDKNYYNISQERLGALPSNLDYLILPEIAHRIEYSEDEGFLSDIAGVLGTRNESASALDLLVTLSGHGSPVIRLSAYRALGNFASFPPAMDVLRHGVEAEKEPHLVDQAVTSIGEILRVQDGPCSRFQEVIDYRRRPNARAGTRYIDELIWFGRCYIAEEEFVLALRPLMIAQGLSGEPRIAYQYALSRLFGAYAAARMDRFDIAQRSVVLALSTIEEHPQLLSEPDSEIGAALALVRNAYAEVGEFEGRSEAIAKINRFLAFNQLKMR